MPRTRSATAAVASSSVTRDSDQATHEDRPEHSDSEGSDEIEQCLLQARKGFKRLQEKSAALKKENEELKADLEKLVEAQDVSIQPKRGKKGGPSVMTLQLEIRELKEEVRKLETARQKLRRRVVQLEAKEAKREAAELGEDAEDNAADDSSYYMRKLLRKFQDFMSETVLDENEECVICMEKLEPNGCSSFPCEHLFCNTCLAQISPGSEIIICPQCRTPSPKSDIEVVRRTASQQWDALMEIAKRWAKLDRRREMSSSEEEAEASFIDDRKSEVSHLSPNNVAQDEPESTSNTLDVQESTPEPATLPSTPPPSGPEQVSQALSSTSYMQSPTADKRKRMQELAEQRKRKRKA